MNGSSPSQLPSSATSEASGKQLQSSMSTYAWSVRSFGVRCSASYIVCPSGRALPMASSALPWGDPKVRRLLAARSERIPSQL